MSRNFLSVNEFSVSRGELVGLLGPNGSGKSTLLRALAGLWPVSSGVVYICGQPVEKMSIIQRARCLSWVPQRAETPFEWSVAEMAATGRHPHLGFRLVDGEVDGRVVEDALRRVGLWDLRHRPVGSLSGGEWQRALLARSLAQEPRVLLLDEPVANLDLGYQRQIYELVRGLCRERGLAVVTADHHVDLQARFCDRLILLDNGTVVAQGTPSDVLRAERLEAVFRTPLRVEVDPLCGRPEVRWRFDPDVPGE